MGISVVIISRDEEHNIARCLDSVRWADEIIVVDSQSQDRTVEIAQSYGAKIYSPEWKGYGRAKKEGVKRASCEWILSLDADEELSAPLIEEIRTAVSRDSNTAGFYIPRRTRFLGRWIKHCGWYPDYVLRLFRKSAGDFNDAPIHEKVTVQGTTGKLTHDILHYSYPTLEEYFAKFDRYTTIGAQEAYNSGSRSGWFQIVIKPPVSFITHYIVRRGFLDGIEGFLVSSLSAAAVMVKYAKLRELHRR